MSICHQSFLQVRKDYGLQAISSPGGVRLPGGAAAEPGPHFPLAGHPLQLVRNPRGRLARRHQPGMA